MAVIAMLLLCSCDAENSISTKYPCQSLFQVTIPSGHKSGNSPQRNGRLTTVSAKKVKGAWNIYSTLNDGKNETQTIILSTAKENYANYTYLGAGNDPKDARKKWLHHGTYKLQRTCSLGPPLPQLSGTIWHANYRWNGPATANR